MCIYTYIYKHTFIHIYMHIDICIYVRITEMGLYVGERGCVYARAREFTGALSRCVSVYVRDRRCAQSPSCTGGRLLVRPRCAYTHTHSHKYTHARAHISHIRARVCAPRARVAILLDIGSVAYVARCIPADDALQSNCTRVSAR